MKHLYMNIERTNDMKYLVSACLLGENCKYSGGNNRNDTLIAYLQDKEYVSVCPEVLGGLPTPRACAEIAGDKVMNTDGEDVTAFFDKGAAIACDIAKAEHIDIAITQPRSPSCGKGNIYSGQFNSTLIEGDGVFVSMMVKNGYTVMTCDEFIQKVIQKEKKEEESAR